MIKSGITSITFRSLSPEEIIKLAVKAKLDGIEWGGDVHAPHGDTAKAAEIRKMTADAGLKAPSYGSYYKCAASEAKGMLFKSVLGSAVALGVRTIRVWAGESGSAAAAPDYRKSVVEDSARIAAMARSEGISVSFEYHGGTLTDTRDSVRTLMTELRGVEGIYFYWQPLNYTLNEKLASLEDVKPLLSNIHVYQWTFKDNAWKRFPLSEGEADWTGFFSSAAKDGKDRFALLEFVPDDDPKHTEREAAALNSALAKAGAR